MIPPSVLEGARVAIVHDYLNQVGGAEKVVEVFAEMFPGAPIYTSVFDRDRMPDFWKSLDVRTSFMQKLTPRVALAKTLVPLFPVAFETFDLRAFDLVLSSTTAFAKAVITRPETFHICYCNNPTRFLWMFHDYFEYGRFSGPARTVIGSALSPLRTWDFAAAQRVDCFVAGSRNAARRISKYYRRESDVVHPPIDGAAYTPSDAVDDYFLVVARLQPYKRIDVAVQACNQLRLPLRIVGAGPDDARLRSMAGPTIQFLGRVSDTEVAIQMARCRALLLPGEEDFGLTPLEAQASGRPVVAFAAGGALETVVPGETGLLYRPNTPASLAAVLTDMPDNFDPGRLRSHALQFDKESFKNRMFSVIAQRYSEYRERMGLHQT